MAEKSMKEILEKLDEIEKLQAKLRGMVTRIKHHETGSSAGVDRRSSKPKKKKGSVASKEEERNSWRQKLSDIEAEKLQNRRASKYLKRLRNNSSNFVAEHWRDKKEKVKNFLSGLVERDIIFVSRASQTSDMIIPKATPVAQQMGNENAEFPRKETRHMKNRASTQEVLQQILDSDTKMEGRVSVHDQPIGNREPRRVRRESSLLPEEETFRILSNARAVSVDDNETNETDSALSSRVRRFVRKYSNDRSQSR